MDERQFSGGSIVSLDTFRPKLHAVFEQFGVVLAYLYGSQARSEAGPLSDVDIAVKFKSDVSKEERFNRQLRLMSDLADVFERPDVYTVDLDDAPALLRHRVYRDGVILYCSDERIRVKFMTDTLRDYIDTKPLRDIQWHYLYKRAEAGSFGRVHTRMAQNREPHG